MEYKVIKEYPGLAVDDILLFDEDAGFYINTATKEEVNESALAFYSNTVALSQFIVEGSPDYFAPVLERSEVEPVVKEGPAKEQYEADLASNIEELQKEDGKVLRGKIMEELRRLHGVLFKLEGDVTMTSEEIEEDIIRLNSTIIYDKISMLNKLLN